MLSNIGLRHLHAITILAEELNFTRAAHRLHITQSALSKQISEIEAECRFPLFKREKKRLTELTNAGRVFVEDARSAVLHADRAVHRARAAHQGSAPILMIGHSPFCHPGWISTLLSTRLPLFPKLRVRLLSGFATDLVRSVLAEELHLALVTAPQKDAQLTAVSFAETHLCAVVPEDHPAATQEYVRLRELANDEWILFGRPVHSLVYDAIIHTAREERIAIRDAHEILTSQQAIHLVAEHVGVALLPGPTALNCKSEKIIIKPIFERSLYFEACLIMRHDDESRVVNEFARTFLRRMTPKLSSAEQLRLPISA